MQGFFVFIIMSVCISVCAPVHGADLNAALDYLGATQSESGAWDTHMVTPDILTDEEIEFNKYCFQDCP